MKYVPRAPASILKNAGKRPWLRSRNFSVLWYWKHEWLARDPPHGRYQIDGVQPDIANRTHKIRFFLNLRHIWRVSTRGLKSALEKSQNPTADVLFPLPVRSSIPFSHTRRINTPGVCYCYVTYWTRRHHLPCTATSSNPRVRVPSTAAVLPSRSHQKTTHLGLRPGPSHVTGPHAQAGSPASDHNILFNKSMEMKCLPSDWKNARITPIYKKGRKNGKEGKLQAS